jgi:hypothetical protein
MSFPGDPVIRAGVTVVRVCASTVGPAHGPGANNIKTETNTQSLYDPRTTEFGLLMILISTSCRYMEGYKKRFIWRGPDLC